MFVKRVCLGITAILLLQHACYGSTIISGTPGAEHQPFPFALGSFYYNPQTLWFFVGAGEAPSTAYRDMSISYVAPSGLSFTGILPETVTLNDQAGQPNPLFGATIEHLSFSEKNILAISQAQKNVLCLIKYFTNPTSMLIYTTEPLKDADGNVSQGVIALEGGPYCTIFGLIVLPATGSFGDTGSQVSFGGFVSSPDPNNPAITNTKLMVDYSGRLERSTPALKVGSDLASISTPATIHIAESFVPLDEEAAKDLAPHFYVGISAIGGAATSDGVRGVLMNANEPITPDAALEANSIIGGIGPNTEVHINRLETLYTSTQLHYLVVAGGVGTAVDTTRSVFALPLTFPGILAKKDALPVTVYNNLGSFWYRCFVTPALVAGDLFSPDNTTDIHKARVGGGTALPGDIVALWTSKDTVFVAINQNNVPTLGGIFCSQALFDTYGRIQGWSNWRRLNGLVTPTVYGAVSPTTGSTLAAVHDAQDVLNTIVRTDWSDLGSFASSTTTLFADQRPGIQGLIDFPHQHTTFSQTVGNRISTIAATGYQRVAFIQSGADAASGFFTPTESLTHVYQTSTGSIGTFPADTDGIVIEGGALIGLGGIVTADIVSDNTYSWLVLGGNGGLAILARPDGSGWDKGAVGKNFVGLPGDAAFKLIGNARNVRKIIADGSNLYFVTDTEMRRFTVSQASVAAASADQPLGSLLASPASLASTLGGSATFSDIAISGPVALLATCNGLARVGNGRSVAVDDATTLDWQYIALPESQSPVTRFYVVSPTGMQHEWATTVAGGNIYVVSGYVAQSQTRVHRLAIEGTVTTISDNTVQLFQDNFTRDVNPSFFVSRGDYRNYAAYDGTIFYLTRSHYHPYGEMHGPALLESMGAWLRTGKAFAESGASVLAVGEGTTMGPLIHRSAQGSMMTSGSSMYTNE